MLDKISGFITDTLIEGNVIKREERDLYLYCFGTIVEMSANLLATLIIGVLLRRFVKTLIFMLVFIPMRSFAGGFHCERSGSCFILSMSVYLAVILTYDFLSGVPAGVILIICLVDFAAVFILSPVTSPNKPISEKKKIKNRRVSIAFSMACLAAVLILRHYEISYAFVILESVTAAVVSMAAGFIKYKNWQNFTFHCSKTSIQINSGTRSK